MVGFFERLRLANDRRKLATKCQSELQGMLQKEGVNFMRLHPTIHSAVLHEAMVYGADRAFRTFISATVDAEAVANADADVGARALLAFYEKHEREMRALLDTQNR